MKEEAWAGPSLGRCILAGLIAGAVAALLANLTAIVLARQFNQPVGDLDWISISRAAMIWCMAGAFVYGGLARWTGRPVLLFVIAGGALVLLYVLLVTMQPASTAGTRIATVRYLVMALAALVLIPALAPTIPQPGRPK